MRYNLPGHPAANKHSALQCFLRRVDEWTISSVLLPFAVTLIFCSLN